MLNTVQRLLRGNTRLSYLATQARQLTTARDPSHHDRDAFTIWSEWPFPAQTSAAIEERLSSDLSELIIGQIDNDGRVLGTLGPLPMVENVGQEEFVKRRQYDLSIVLINQVVLIRKDFRGNRASFIHEWFNLQYLRSIGQGNIPAVYAADEDNCCLYKSMIKGRTLRDLMVDEGAEILTIQTQDDLEFQGLTQAQRIEAVWQRGQEVLGKVVPASFLSDLRWQIRRIHKAGVVKLSLTFGNVMVGAADSKPWLIDFENSEYFRWKTHPLYWRRRKQDIEKFRRIYGISAYDEPEK
ncbi:MAG: hypothetical protein KJ047_03900 [Anaerolineae bacterium]|nr:hypothetical protein [Anaerolineae bacterium]